MKVAVVQMACAVGDVEANAARMVQAVGEAGREGAGLVVFPELCDTGYDMDAVRRSAAAWPGGACGALAAASTSANVATVCGLSERDGENLHNSCAVFGSGGELLASYRKAHLYRTDRFTEADTFTPGDSLTTVKIGPLCLGLLICFDLRFPEHARSLVLQGAKALVVVSAWPAVRAEHWRALLTARAVENQCYVVAANRVGEDCGIRFCGRSCVLGPDGEALVEAGGEESSILYGNIELPAVRSARKQIPALDCRRPSLYTL